MHEDYNRIALYHQVSSLHNSGLKPRLIAELTRCPEDTVRHWIRRDRHPLSNFNQVNLSPSAELSYVIGAVFGDGSLVKAVQHRKGKKWGTHYRIKLSAKDREFVVHFNHCLSKIISRANPYILKRTHRNSMYTVVAKSKILFDFLKGKKVREFKPIIDLYPAEFIRGFADSEGGVSDNHGTPQIRIYNTNLELLCFIRDLLGNRFNIESSIYKAKSVYVLDIAGKDDAYKFTSRIGFNIRRKQDKLEMWVKNLTLKDRFSLGVLDEA